MAIAVPSPLIPRLAEALGLDANRCRSIDLHLRADDVLTVSTVQYIDEEQADRVIKVMQSAEYVLVPKADIEGLRQHRCLWGNDPSGPTLSDEYLASLDKLP